MAKENISLKGFEKLTKLMKGRKEKMRGIINKEMETFSFDVQGSAQRNAPADRGRLRASIVNIFRVNGNEIIAGVGSNTKYAPAQERGGKWFPPLAPLIKWASRKGANNPRQMAFAVRKKIGVDVGLGPDGKGFRFMEKGLDSGVDKFVSRLESRIEQGFWK